jgi:hypothetical protein
MVYRLKQGARSRPMQPPTVKSGMELNTVATNDIYCNDDVESSNIGVYVS